MVVRNKEKTFFTLVDASLKLAKATDAEAVLLLLDRSFDWSQLKKKGDSAGMRILVASATTDTVQDALDAEIATIELDLPESSVQDRLTQAVLESVASEHVASGSTVIAVYSSFDAENLDTMSVLKLTERLVRLTARDLRKLETKVPLETLKIVVDLAVEIGKEGREGKPVGTMFVVGDHRRVMEESRPGGFDAMKGYNRKDRNLTDPKVREGIKELAQLDGMFVVSADGTVESCAGSLILRRWN